MNIGILFPSASGLRDVWRRWRWGNQRFFICRCMSGMWSRFPLCGSRDFLRGGRIYMIRVNNSSREDQFLFPQETRRCFADSGCGSVFLLPALAERELLLSSSFSDPLPLHDRRRMVGLGECRGSGVCHHAFFLISIKIIATFPDAGMRLLRGFFAPSLFTGAIAGFFSDRSFIS